MNATGNWPGPVPTPEQHVALMRAHAKQLRDQADRYEAAAASIEGAEIPTPSTTPTRAIPSTHRVVAAKAVTPPRASSKPREETLERNRKAVESQGLTAASKALGVNYATLYGQATRLGWKVAKSTRQKAPAPRPSRSKGDPETPGALRRCDRCEQMTRSDPCQHCGHKWKREK